MKNIYLIMAGGALAISALSCNGLKTEENTALDNAIEIELSADSNATKAFSEGDELGLYLVSSETSGVKDLSQNRTLNNIKFTMINGKFISNPACMFPENENILNSIFVYHPYSDLSVEDGAKDMKVAVSYDQRQNLDKNDLIFGVKHDYKPSSSRLTMSLSHALAKVNIKIKPGKGYESAEELGNPSVLILDNIQEGYFDFNSVRPSETYPRYDMYPNGFFTIKDNVLHGVSAILIPQVIPAGNAFIRLIINEQEYTYAAPENLDLKMGTENTVTLTINKGFDGVSVVIGDLTIEDWAVEKFEYDLTELSKPEGTTVKDIDGNIYNIVQIGEQFWMASNLRVTKLNDGTPIKKNDRKLSEWSNYTEPAYIAYNFDETNVAKYGYLYNKFNVNSEKICPEGWSVPSSTDWDILAEYLGGVMDRYHCWKGCATAMKSVSWAPGTNESGFDAIPAGSLFSAANSPDKTQFQQQGSATDWWSATGSFTRALSGKNSLDRYLSADVFGASIRCIYNRKPIK